MTIFTNKASQKYSQVCYIVQYVLRVSKPVGREYLPTYWMYSNLLNKNIQHKKDPCQHVM